MEWHDEAIVLSARPHGENASIVNLLTANHGRHAGLVAGGQGRSWHGVLQPGNQVSVRWRARLSEHLGHFTLDLMATSAAAWLNDPLVLGVINSACVVTEAALPERHALPQIHGGLQALLSLQDADLWGASYVKWEIGLLAALGYGLDLTRCAVSGGADELAYVSPRTGRAVSQQAGAPYHNKLLSLPPFLLGEAGWEATEVLQGLMLTGHFLSRYVFAQPQNRTLVPRAGELPAARLRLIELYRRQCNQMLDESAAGETAAAG
jgi:DNA repair protein RecO (recombination protein O)